MASDDLRALGRLGLGDRLVEPELVSVGILNGEGPVAPPLGGERRRDADAGPLQLVVIGVDVLHLHVDLDRTLVGRRRRTGHPLLRAPQHDPHTRPHHRHDVEPAVLPDDTHHVLEAQLLRVEAVELVDRVHRDDRHDAEALFLVHSPSSAAQDRRRLVLISTTRGSRRTAMRSVDDSVLAELGLTHYERQALVTLMMSGVADAATLCREGAIPTSKIYRAMEKLRDLGLAQIQPSRPRLFAALPPEAVAERMAELARERADGVAAGARTLLDQLARRTGRTTGRHAFVDLALGRSEE